MTLSDLSDACDTCDVRATFTGRVQVGSDGRKYAILRCPSCHADIPVWTRGAEAFVAEWVRNPLPDGAFHPLRSGDPAAIAAYLADPPARVPSWRLTDVAVPAEAALDWCDLVLDHPGLFPPPTVVDRVEEALAAALLFAEPDCAEAAAERLGLLSGAETLQVLLRMPARSGDRSGRALAPFVRAVRAAGGDRAAALKTIEARWALPGLREALEA